MSFFYQKTALALICLGLFCGQLSAWASPNSLTYQGRILKADGQGLEYSSVSFLFEITSEDGACVLYREQKDGVNLANSKGVFDVSIGTGTRLFPDAGANPTYKLADSFVNGVVHNCSGSGIWSSSIDSFRKLKVQFNDGVGIIQQFR